MSDLLTYAAIMNTQEIPVRNKTARMNRAFDALYRRDDASLAHYMRPTKASLLRIELAIRAYDKAMAEYRAELYGESEHGDNE